MHTLFCNKMWKYNNNPFCSRLKTKRNLGRIAHISVFFLFQITFCDTSAETIQSYFDHHNHNNFATVDYWFVVWDQQNLLCVYWPIPGFGLVSDTWTGVCSWNEINYALRVISWLSDFWIKYVMTKSKCVRQYLLQSDRYGIVFDFID